MEGVSKNDSRGLEDSKEAEMMSIRAFLNQTNTELDVYWAP